MEIQKISGWLSMIGSGKVTAKNREYSAVEITTESGVKTLNHVHSTLKMADYLDGAVGSDVELLVATTDYGTWIQAVKLADGRVIQDTALPNTYTINAGLFWLSLFTIIGLPIYLIFFFWQVSAILDEINGRIATDLEGKTLAEYEASKPPGFFKQMWKVAKYLAIGWLAIGVLIYLGKLMSEAGSSYSPTPATVSANSIKPEQGSTLLGAGQGF